MSSVVPEGWNSKRLGDVASLIMGQSPTSDTYNDNKNGTPFFQGKADFGVKYPKVRYWCTSPTKIAPIDSILFSVRAPVGAVNLNNIEACIGRGLASISGKSIDNTFLYQSLIHAKVKFEALGQGSTFEAINGNELKEFPLVCPPLPEQKKIASILTSVDEVIENTQKQIDKLQDLKKATMNELLTKGIGHTEFKDSELGRIPKNWEVVYLENQLQLMTDFVANGSFEALRNNVEVFDYNEYALYVRLFDLRKGLGHASQKYIDNKSFRFLKKSSLVKNDLLIANIGANVGEVFLMPEVLQPASIAPNMILMRSKNSVDPHFLYNFLISDWGEQLVSLAISGSGQPKINKTDLKKTLILMPPHTEQKEIASIISSVDIVINRKYEKLSQTQSLKKSLMQDLLTGKVRVTVN